MYLRAESFRNRKEGAKRDRRDTCLQGFLAHQNHPTPEDHQRSLSIGLL